MRVDNIREMMRNNGFDAVLVGTNANLYYLTGGVFSGYVYIPAEGEALQFVRRPVDKKGDGIVHIRKPEQNCTESPIQRMDRSMAVSLSTSSP